MVSRSNTSRRTFPVSWWCWHLQFFLFAALLFTISMLFRIPCHDFSKTALVTPLGEEKQNSLQNKVPKKISVTFERAFQKEVVHNITQTPPHEQSWLLSSTDHPVPVDHIPHIVNKLYFQRNGEFPRWEESHANLIDAHNSWPKMNPNHSIRYFNLLLAREYLQTYYHPVFLRAFDCIEAFSGKSNLFRMALLYREGGWHSDWKQTCLVPNILDRISNETDYFVSVDLGVTKKCAQTAFVGVRPRHPAIAKYLERILMHVSLRSYVGNALNTTGPCVFGKGVAESGFKFSPKAKFISVAGKNNTKLLYFLWEGTKIVLHKCVDCGASQNWDRGNNYIQMWKDKTYYCEDAESIFAN